MNPTPLRPLIAGNWKMNGLLADGTALARNIAAHVGERPEEVLLCPPATLLHPLAEILLGSAVQLGAQDCHTEPCGAFTGDLSAAMLKDAGCSYVILGHSERRLLHGETSALVAAKASAAWTAGLSVILCVGETARQRDGGRAFAVVRRQIRDSLPTQTPFGRLVIAYEPIWAIGSGQVAGLDDIAAMHGAIRAALATKAGKQERHTAQSVRILYGGSVSAQNAAPILALPDVDGALVGGASLDAEAFCTIVFSCC
jgi:triosephosphate isomerase